MMPFGEMTSRPLTKKERGSRYGCSVTYRNFGAIHCTGTKYFYAASKEDALRLIRSWENLLQLK